MNSHDIYPAIDPAISRRRSAGISLIETTIGLGVLLVASVGVLTLAAVVMTTTEDQGHLAARAAEYAQDKMEQLIGLSYGDLVTDTRVFPAAPSGGTGLAVGGSADPDSPVTGYVDYLDRAGNLLPVGASAPDRWYYIRVWQVSTPTGTTNLKEIRVTARVRNGVGSKGSPPEATMVSLKTNPF